MHVLYVCVHDTRVRRVCNVCRWPHLGAHQSRRARIWAARCIIAPYLTCYLETRSLAGPGGSHFSSAGWPWSSGIHLSPPTNTRDKGTSNPVGAGDLKLSPHDCRISTLHYGDTSPAPLHIIKTKG